MSAPTIDLRERRVEGHGPLNCTVAICGEAAGEEEEKAGIPFVGSSGKLLCNDILAKAGIRRKIAETYVQGVGTKVSVESECYVTNVVKVFLGKGDKVFEKRFYSD